MIKTDNQKLPNDMIVTKFKMSQSSTFDNLI